MIKKCSKCKKEKDLNDFWKKGKYKGKQYFRSYCKECQKEYYKKPDVIERRKEYQKELMKNPKNRLDSNMRNLIRYALKGVKAGRSWKKLVNYPIEDLIKHLEKQFDEKMNWDNYGSYWEVDHIKPKSLFKYVNPEEPNFQECWALKNIQPLERIENRRKGNRFNK